MTSAVVILLTCMVVMAVFSVCMTIRDERRLRERDAAMPKPAALGYPDLPAPPVSRRRYNGESELSYRNALSIQQSTYHGRHNHACVAIANLIEAERARRDLNPNDIRAVMSAYAGIPESARKATAQNQAVPIPHQTDAAVGWFAICRIYNEFYTLGIINLPDSPTLDTIRQAYVEGRITLDEFERSLPLILEQEHPS